MSISLGQTSTGQGFGSSIATSGVTTQATGSTFAVLVDQGGNATASVTDSHGNTYTSAGSVGISGGGNTLSLYYCVNGVGGSSHTVTVTLPSSNGITVLFAEFLGLGAATPGTFSSNTSSYGSVSTITAPSQTIAANSLILCGFGLYGQAAQTIADSGAGFSVAAKQATNSGANAALSWASGSTGSFADTFSWTTAYAASSFTFNLTAGGSPNPLAGAAASSAIATGALSTQARFSSAATAAASATGALTNYATVTLAAPLYAGVGSLLDPEIVWANGAPVAGDVIYYDPTYITIATNGEVVSSSNNCSALVQFYDGTQWNVAIVVITPNMVGYAASTTTSSATLAGPAAAFAGGASAASVAVGALITGITAAGAAAANTAATGVLTTQDQLSGAANVAAAANGTLGSVVTAPSIVQQIACWGGRSSVASASFTPGAGHALLVYGMDGQSTGRTLTFTDSSGGTLSPLTPPGQYSDSNGNTHATAANLVASAVAQTLTVASTTGDGLYCWGLEIAGATAITSSANNVSAPTSGTVQGNAVTVPTSAMLIAVCVCTSAGAPTLTTTGTTYAAGSNSAGPFGALAYLIATYAGTGAQITPTFTTTGTTGQYTVMQWLVQSTAGAALAGGAASASVSTGTLTNYSTVTLANPLYTGNGSIVASGAPWSAGAPTAGSVVYYDGTNITILPDGEVVSSVNNCIAFAQWNTGTTWSQLIIVITPAMSGTAAANSTLSGVLTTAIQVIGGAASLVTASGSLAGAAQIAGYAVDTTTAMAALSTAIQAAGAAITAATVSGTLSNPTPLYGNAIVAAGAAGALQTAINLAAATQSVVVAAAQLSTQITLIAAALSATSAAGSLTTGNARLSGTAEDDSYASASMLTQIQLSGGAATLNAAVASLSAQIELLGYAASASNANGQIAIPKQLGGAAAALSQASSNLSTLVKLSGLAWVSAAAQGALTASITLPSEAIAQVTAGGSLYTVPSVAPPSSLATIRVAEALPWSDYQQVGDLPYGEFSQSAGAKIWYGISWTDLLANRWQPDTNVSVGQSFRPTTPNGYQYTCVTAGRTGATMPTLDAYVGANILDGSVVWVCASVDNSSLEATVVTSYWNADDDLALASGGVVDEVSLVLVDTTGAMSGVDYDVQCTATMSDGQVNVGIVRIKVR